ncbi:phytoene desaturase family protein [Marinococcus halophilus]|uniref:phytoene desaturase family protein n=1 Tax=Marinococcus halophilus TaxID=1371 RepID=UPI0015C426B0|nr:FAD-dependent oxidoreductase [Marinococcus halophilus]
MSQPSVIIIGGGFGGLTASALLACHHYNVTLFEASNEWGGCAGKFTHKPHLFPVGATLGLGLQQPDGLHYRVFNYLKEPLPEHVGLETIMQVHAPSFSLPLYSSREKHIDTLCRLFPSSADGIRSLYRYISRVGEELRKLIHHLPVLPMQKPADFIRSVRALRPGILGAVRWLAASTEDVLRHYRLQDTEVHQYIDGQLLDSLQTSSRHAPALLGLYALDLYHQGASYVYGGLYRMAEQLKEAAERHSASMQKRRRIQAVERNSDGTWTAIDHRERRTTADHLVLNIPVQAALPLFHPKERNQFTRRWQTKSETPIWSTFSMYGVCEPSAPPSALFHQLLWDQNIPGISSHLFYSLSAPDDRTRAPEGERTFTVSTHTPPEFWEDLSLYEEKKSAATRALVEKIQEAGLPVQPERVLPGAPHAWERYIKRPRGMVGGFPQTRRDTFFYPLSHRSPLENVWFCGDSIFPGASTMAVTMSGIHVFESISGQSFAALERKQ